MIDMARGPTYVVPFRRRREDKTNYRKRIALLKSHKPRFVVRKTNKLIIAQYIDFDPKGDITLVRVDSRDLKKYGMSTVSKNLPASYLVGYLASKIALKKGIKEAVFDMGVNISSKGNRLYSALAGAIDAGVSIPHNPEILPSRDRIEGKHIKGFEPNIVNNVKKKIDEVVK